MGHSSYSTVNRAANSISNNYATASVDKIFVQQVEQQAHKAMKSVNIELREARDSENHPNSVPIILALDVTGSMGYIPHELIKDGLPTIMGNIIKKGVADPALLFLGIGDHEYDNEPLQVGQFESGDEELDMWLTRTYLEGGGGGNEGESYGLAHYFAARHTATDAWDKRKQKGILITVGDEPNLTSYPTGALREITGNGDIKTFTDKEIFEEALEKWDIYHIYPVKYWDRPETVSYWKQLLGDRYFRVDNVADISKRIIEIITTHSSVTALPADPAPTNPAEEQEIL